MRQPWQLAPQVKCDLLAFFSEEKRTWIVTLFFGAMCLFSVRTVMSVCALEISKEFNYDKTQMARLLSSFFYGYPITQVPGGYLSDKIGGDLMIYYTAIVWGLLTFFLPYVGLFSSDKYYVLALITFLRMLTGGFQGEWSLTCSDIGRFEK